MVDILGKEEYFDDLEKNHLKERIRETIGFIRKNNIKTVVIAGYSGVYARDFLRAAWQKLHPAEKIPKFYSLGDSPERTMGGTRQDDWIVGNPPRWEKFPLFRKDMEERMPSLFDALEHPVLVLDETENRGNTLKNTASLLKKLGAKEVHAFPLATEVRLSTIYGRGQLQYAHVEKGRKGLEFNRIKMIKGELRKLAREL